MNKLLNLLIDEQLLGVRALVTAFQSEWLIAESGDKSPHCKELNYPHAIQIWDEA